MRLIITSVSKDYSGVRYNMNTEHACSMAEDFDPAMHKISLQEEHDG